MKVKELLKALENVNPEMNVFCTSNTGEYEYCIVNSCGERELIIESGDADTDDVVETFFVIDEQ